MRHDTCCVLNCKNNGKNVDLKLKFYKFPQATWKREQRMKWIIAVNRKNADGSLWLPKSHDRICSAHFIGGKKADEQNSPSYSPTIFPVAPVRVNPNLAISRYERQIKRTKKGKNTAKIHKIDESKSLIEIMENIHSTQNDKECQIEMFLSFENEGNTFICNRFLYSGKGICDSQVQTEISINE